MTEGISKERLEKHFNRFFDDDDYNFEQCAKSILAECEDLDPWLPVNEDTPKDRDLLVTNSKKQKRIGI